MDWTKQNEEMFKAWTQAQTKMWEAYSLLIVYSP